MNGWIRACLTATLLAAAGRAQELPDIDDEEASEALAQSLEHFQSRPVNLNRATPDEIAAIPLLYPLEALALARYLRRHPGLADPARLVRDSVLSEETLDAIMPYICLSAPDGRALPAAGLRSAAQRRWPDSGGGDPYQGSPVAHRLKLSARHGPFEAAALSQKDAGERSHHDFLSAAVSFSSRSGALRAVAGDYQLCFGQGLVFGGAGPKFLSALSGGPSGGGSLALRPNSSLDEWSLLRGGAIQAGVGDGWTLAAFASRKRRDGSLDSTGLVRSMENSGYHRTNAELRRRAAVAERLGGVRIERQAHPRLRIGLYGYGAWYQPGLSPGRRVMPGGGVDGALDFAEGQFFWEAAAPLRSRPALVAGVRFGPGALRTFLTARHYGPGYAAPRSNAPGRASQDERGITIGSSLRAPHASQLSAVFDLDQPVSPAGALARGHGGYLMETVVVNRSIPGVRLEWRWRSRRQEDVTGDTLFRFARASRNASRIGLRWEAGRRLSLAASFETCRWRREDRAGSSRGDLLAARVTAVPRRGWKVTASTALFATDSYDARLYGVEPELPGAGSFHPLYGQGRRDAVMFSYQIRSLLSLQAKVARQQRRYQGADRRQTEAGLALQASL